MLPFADCLQLCDWAQETKDLLQFLAPWLAADAPSERIEQVLAGLTLVQAADHFFCLPA